MCPACELLTGQPKAADPHRRMHRRTPEVEQLATGGRVFIDRFQCGRCGTNLQRDSTGTGQRLNWRAT